MNKHLAIIALLIFMSLAVIGYFSMYQNQTLEDGGNECPTEGADRNEIYVEPFTKVESDYVICINKGNQINLFVQTSGKVTIYLERKIGAEWTIVAKKEAYPNGSQVLTFTHENNGDTRRELVPGSPYRFQYENNNPFTITVSSSVTNEHRKNG